MTGAEWMACTDPDGMLEYIQGRASERKLRLFVIGCSRFVWEQIIDEEWRAAINEAELYADGLLAKEEFDLIGIHFQALSRRLRSEAIWASSSALIR